MPMKTDGLEPKFTPSITSVGLEVSSPTAATFEIINCGGGAGAAAKTAGGNEMKRIKLRPINTRGNFAVFPGILASYSSPTRMTPSWFLYFEALKLRRGRGGNQEKRQSFLNSL